VCHGSTGGDHIDELYIATAPVDWPMEEEGGLPAGHTKTKIQGEPKVHDGPC